MQGAAPRDVRVCRGRGGEDHVAGEREAPVGRVHGALAEGAEGEALGKVDRGVRELRHGLQAGARGRDECHNGFSVRNVSDLFDSPVGGGATFWGCFRMHWW